MAQCLSVLPSVHLSIILVGFVKIVELIIEQSVMNRGPSNTYLQLSPSSEAAKGKCA